jgi:NAD(P)-dependent dehydrogenase (short-subunit alcohol dehydrogenase family)
MSNNHSVVLITGTSSGFGRLMAGTLARNGCRVIATMRCVNGKNAGTASELRALAARESLTLKVLELDVTRDDEVEQAVTSTIEENGRIDVLIHNAAYGVLGVTETYTVKQMQRMFDANFFGVVRLNRAVLPHMRRRRSGLLIYVSSGAGRIVLPCMGAYSASKFALEAIAETYRYELAGQGIDSVIVQPGAYPTGVLGKLEAGEDASRADSYGTVNEIPAKLSAWIGKSGANPQEVADAVLKIMETPAGQRRFRHRLGKGAGGVETINDTCEQVQERLLEAFGIADATKFRKDATAGS